MPRTSLDISDFRYGTIKRSDGRDIPIQAAIDSDNIDGDAPYGRLQGVQIAGSDLGATKLAVNAKRSAWIVDSSNKWNLVYVHGDTSNQISIVKDFYGTPAGVDYAAYNGYSFVVHNQECHVGCGQTNAPQWIGYCNYAQLGGSTVGWVGVSAVMPQAVGATGDIYSYVAGHSGATTPFDSSKTYIYKLSMIYDYVQESPLQSDGLTPNSVNAGAGTYDYITSTITIYGASSLNKRVTGCKLYRADVSNDDATNTSLFRLIKQFDITGALAHTGYTWTASGGDYTTTWNDDNTLVGATYEQETGIAETLNSNYIYYTLSCEAGGSLFAVGCSKTEIPDASHMLFKSQSYRYDMFNWSAIGSFLRLPTQPTAMVAFNGKVWIFDANNMYRIDPGTLVIEESSFGVGCLSQRSILVTPYGMYWCDAKNAYWHDGQTITTIGDSIRSNTAPWHGFLYISAADTQDQQPFIVFSPVKSSILFIVPETTTTNGRTNVWVWHVTRKIWNSYSSFTSTCGSSTGGFTGKDGEVYIADTTHLYNAFGGTNFRAIYWTSGDLPKEDINQLRTFYKFKTTSTNGTSSFTKTYSVDKGATFETLPNDTDIIDQGTSTWEKQNQIRLKVAMTSGTGYIDSISLVYRNMIGER